MSVNKIEKDLKSISQNFATKEDVAMLNTKISDTKSEIIKWMFIF